ncbi:MAG TPA: MliC family protein [Marinospirillum sp.]|uniref:MliC family protein n=1 Tax=Marinospirillum sp. TaxID=2183934 RepID=UPI002B48B537|nr:MliC family protein [Marinospirillum sp.]HKM14871.1 MliC family protein [Marinospirillum sp.]
MTLASLINKRLLLQLATTLLAAGLLVGCTFTPKFEQATQANLWQCEDGSLMETRLLGEQLWLQLPATTHWINLPQQRAASGARYANGEGASVWNKGNKARVTTPERTWKNCQLISQGEAGKLDKPPQITNTNTSPNALVLRATGHNPSWTFEAQQNGTLVLLQNFGTQRIKFAASEVIKQDLIRTLYQANDVDGNLIEYKVENILCIEINTGEPFPHRVELQYLDKKYQGCGQSF